MITLVSSKDILHKTHLLRLLREILNTPTVASKLAFKGGTYAALRGVLKRFSVDLDFDLLNKDCKLEVKRDIEVIIKKLGYTIKDQSKNHLQYFLKYSSEEFERNTLKLEINDETSPYNSYESVNLDEINQICIGHTLDTMFSNKLFASTARFKKNGKIAGRDFYDIHQFFLQGIPINRDIVEERTGKKYNEYMSELITFIEANVTTQKLIQDLNTLVTKDEIKITLPHIKDEILIYIKNEIRK